MNGAVAGAWLWVTLGQVVPLGDVSGGLPTPTEDGDALTGEANETSEVINRVVERLAREANEQGRTHLAKEDYAAAFESFRQAYELDDSDAEIVHNLARTLHQLGNFEDAEDLYRRVVQMDTTRADAYRDYADLLLERNIRLEEAWKLLAHLRELQGNRRSVLLRQARVAAARDQFNEAQRLYDMLTSRFPRDAELHLEVGDFYRRYEHDDAALHRYRAAMEAPAHADVARARINDLRVEREALKHGMTGARSDVSQRARELVEMGRKAAGHGDWSLAQRRAYEALERSPHYARAYELLGDAHQNTRRIGDAEIAYLRGLAFAPNDDRLLARLGAHYLSLSLGLGNEHVAAGAVAMLERAVQMRPDRAELRLSLAHALRRAGDLPRALREVNAYIDGLPGEGEVDAAALELQAATRALLEAGPEPGDFTEVRQSDLRYQATRRLNRARVLLAEGQTDRALAELAALDDESLGASIHGAVGRILQAAGHYHDAAEAFTRAIEIEPRRVDVLRELGVAQMEGGERVAAEATLRRARLGGDGEAGFHLARMAVAKLESTSSLLDDLRQLPALLELRDELVEWGEAGFAYRGQAQAALERVRARLNRVWFVLAVLVGLVVIGVSWSSWRRFGGRSLEYLIASHPDSIHSVQQVLSAIRHEVLKHNTMVLEGLVQAMARGDDVSVQAGQLKHSLLGDDAHPGVIDRLAGYIRQLHAAANAHEVRLNLRYRDPALGPILKGMDMLRGDAELLPRLVDLGSADHRRALSRLRKASNLLNVRGYRGIRGLLDHIRILPVDDSLLRGVFSRICREPGLAALEIAPISVQSEGALPCNVGISRGHFEDILGNLYRNAIQWSDSSAGAIQVGVTVREEVDPITAHERVAFLVCDKADETLDVEAVRSPGIEGGLGIVVNLVNRYGGTLDVEPMPPGWTKAVVVRLPRGDFSDDDGGWRA